MPLKTSQGVARRTDGSCDRGLPHVWDRLDTVKAPAVIPVPGD